MSPFCGTFLSYGGGGMVYHRRYTSPFCDAFSQLQQCVGPPLLTFKFPPKFCSVIYVFPLIRFPFLLIPFSYLLQTLTLSKFLPLSTLSKLHQRPFAFLHTDDPSPPVCTGDPSLPFTVPASTSAPPTSMIVTLPTSPTISLSSR